ncbi:hypothetical protein P3T37_003532 [Kitasatospora sp. MAA4]|nr:hypothetical protein [Kitasatospora sp. MAA4]
MQQKAGASRLRLATLFEPPNWGSGGRRFKSCRPDLHFRRSEAVFAEMRRRPFCCSVTRWSQRRSHHANTPVLGRMVRRGWRTAPAGVVDAAVGVAVGPVQEAGDGVDGAAGGFAAQVVVDVRGGRQGGVARGLGDDGVRFPFVVRLLVFVVEFGVLVVEEPAVVDAGRTASNAVPRPTSKTPPPTRRPLRSRPPICGTDGRHGHGERPGMPGAHWSSRGVADLAAVQCGSAGCGVVVAVVVSEVVACCWRTAACSVICGRSV